MKVRFCRSSLVRSLALLAVLSASGCAFSRQPEFRPWIPGSYDFEATLDGSVITGTIEVDSDGPMSVTTSLGACWPRPSVNYLRSNRTGIFLCADHQMVMRPGTRVGPPITGTISDSRTATRYEYVDRCVRYESAEEGRICVEWKQEMREVNERVGGSARIWLVDSEDSAGWR